jgi:hypothetical protein
MVAPVVDHERSTQTGLVSPVKVMTVAQEPHQQAVVVVAQERMVLTRQTAMEPMVALV